MGGGADSGYFFDALGRRFPLARPARPAEPVSGVASLALQGEEPAEESPDYGSMTRAELQRAAREAGHVVKRTHTRDDLIGLLLGGA
jgi:hypothetical protein